MPNTDPSLIECHIRRFGPTHVNIQGFDYVFKKNKAGRKVCKVLNAGHRSYLLGLKDFTAYDGPTDAEMEQKEFDQQTEDSLLDSAGQGETGEEGETQDVETSGGDTLETTEDSSEGPTGDDDFILKSDGQPFANQGSANTAASSRGLKEHEYSVVEYEDGYAVRTHK